MKGDGGAGAKVAILKAIGGVHSNKVGSFAFCFLLHRSDN